MRDFAARNCVSVSAGHDQAGKFAACPCGFCGFSWTGQCRMSHCEVGVTIPTGWFTVAMESKGRSVLVVDDDAKLLSTIAMILRRAGYCVTTTIGPMEALDSARGCAGAIDLLLTDI